MTITLEEIRAVCDDELLESRDLDKICELVSAGRTRTRVVPIADIQAELQSTGEWWAIKRVLRDTDHVAFDAAEAIMDVANSRYQNIDMTLPMVQQMFGGLVYAGLLSQTTLDKLAAMSIESDPVPVQAAAELLYEPDGTPKWH